MLSIKSIKNSYFFSAFFWSTLCKILNAVLGFISVPLLLGYFGKADYGLLTIATVCNGYMHLMDLGMNTGTIKFIAQWEAEGQQELIHKVSRTNITFYLLISLVNSLLLVFLAIWGESLFSVTHEQFLKLRNCFYILAIFSPISWISTVYTQLLTAYKKISFTMQIQCILSVLRALLIVAIFIFSLTLIEYFFYLTFFVSLAIIPYMIRCKRAIYIVTFKPAVYWSDFKSVLSFSIALFALSLFQVTATQSRPIIFSIFSDVGAEAVADFNIVQVIPSFIITLCASLTGIFLPKTSEMLIKSNRNEIQSYVNSWTLKTTILVCTLCFPFIVGAKEILSAYVGLEYVYLAKWLQIWCFFLIIQMHSTPAYSFVISNGKTKILVYATSIACILSILLNALLCKVLPVGSAIIGYVLYMILLIGVYYLYLYKVYLKLNRLSIFLSFIKPTTIAILCVVFPYSIDVNGIFNGFVNNSRIVYILEFASRSLLWLVPFFMLLFTTKMLNVSVLKKENYEFNQ